MNVSRIRKPDLKIVVMIAAAVTIAVMLATSSAYASSANLDVVAEHPKIIKKLDVLETVITSVDNSSITIVGDGGEEIRLLAMGRWLIISEEIIPNTNWADAMSYVENGEATVVMGVVTRGNETHHICLGLKQGELIMFRPILLRIYAAGHRHTKTYMGPRGELVAKGENYMILERDSRRVIAVTGGRWIKAGGGEVTWSNVADEFHVGDTVRLFCHNILVMRKEFSDVFGIDAFIWGYSGAIIDLTSGAALSRA
ncbi:MAG: hypothetical protein J7J19_01290 [Thaumarchaeota archaeon]|nr:hypothetical protein [Nitrososphaerota archaeon]